MRAAFKKAALKIIHITFCHILQIIQISFITFSFVAVQCIRSKSCMTWWHLQTKGWEHFSQDPAIKSGNYIVQFLVLSNNKIMIKRPKIKGQLQRGSGGCVREMSTSCTTQIPKVLGIQYRCKLPFTLWLPEILIAFSDFTLRILAGMKLCSGNYYRAWIPASLCLSVRLCSHSWILKFAANDSQGQSNEFLSVSVIRGLSWIILWTWSISWAKQYQSP